MPSARCAYRVPNGTTFFEHGGALAEGYSATDRDHPIRQVAGAAFRMHRDAKRLSELRVAAGQTPADDPFIPTLLHVFLAHLTGSPEAALAILDAHARGPDVSIDQVLEPPLVSPPLLDARERFFTAAGTAKSVRAFVADARAALDAALEQAAREIEQHMPEAVPHVGESSAAPWLEVAQAAKSAGIDERDPRCKGIILDYFDATDFRPRPTSVATPWCGAFAAHCMKASGNPTAAASIPKGAAAAASWRSWGIGLPWPSTRIPEGAVVVLSPNHVGFFSGFEGDRVFLLGGNQSDRVDKTPFRTKPDRRRALARFGARAGRRGSAPCPGHRRHALRGAVGDLPRQAGRDGVRQQLQRGEQAWLLRPLAIRRRCSCRCGVCARRYQQQEFALARGLDRQGWRAQPRRLVVPARCAERGHARLHARALQWPAQERRAVCSTRRRRASPGFWPLRI